MRWLAPTADTDVAAARRQLIRVHQAFLYDTVRGRRRRDSRAGGSAIGRGADNPYSELAVDIMNTIREQRADAVAEPRGLSQDARDARHAAARAGDRLRPAAARRCASSASSSASRAIAFLDPRTTVDRLYAGGVRMQRAMEFLEFIEAQEPVIAAGTSVAVRVPRPACVAARRRLVSLGIAALVVGAALYVVLADDRDVRNMLPSQMPYDAVHLGLLVVLIVLIVSLVAFIRGLSRED